MTATMVEARDECMAKVKAVVDTLFVGSLVRWPGVERWEVPPQNARWFWPHMQHMNSQQASLSCEHGKRRWRREGIITVQCFAPLSAGGFDEAEQMATAIRAAFEGSATESGVWFRDATANEVGPDASWYQFNARVQFIYDEVR